MSSLSAREKSKLESLFGMASGYVLNFSDSTFGTFFGDFDIDIHSERYQGGGASKAKKLREFWRLESDTVVGEVTHEMIAHYEDYAPESEKKPIAECKAIASRLRSGTTVLSGLKNNRAICDSAYISKQVKRMESAIHDDPSLAIGTAKELIETCCKTILEARGIEVSATDDIPKLTKSALKSLNLVPDGIDESIRGADVIKRLLSNLGTIGNGLAELRGLYGTGHGKHSRANGLTARHAKLAVGAAVTLVTFLFDTHVEEKND